MKIGFVVQRYGETISGGAELHCRLVAEHLLPRHQVEVFTTCASDYVTWKNEFKAGTEKINGVTVHRFPVKRNRNIRKFVDIQNLVFHQQQAPEYEERWIRENGPWCPKLIREITRRRDIDTWILFSYRYWTTVESLRRMGRKALLVPTAEHDPALYLNVFKSLFHLPGAMVYNSHEERELIQSISDNRDVPGDIVGVGLVENTTNTGSHSVPPSKIDFDSMSPYIIYVGRIDKNKGCDHMFRLFSRFCREVRDDITLALIGTPVIPIPDNPRIVHLGFVSEAEKINAIQRSKLLLMPSAYESLSMVLLEAWRESRPALVNKKCEVLDGQCRRSNGGLAYGNFEEFSEALQFLLNHESAAHRIGKQGYQYYLDNYQWPLIVEKYEALLSETTGYRKGTHGAD